MNSDNKIIRLKPFIKLLQAADPDHDRYLAELEMEQDETARHDEAYESYMKSIGLGIEAPEYDGGHVELDMTNPDDIMRAFDNIVFAQRQEHIEATEALDVIRGWMKSADREAEDGVSPSEPAIRDPHPDEPLTLFEAVCLPELGGQLYVGKDILGTPSPNIAVKTLRGAISRGQLAVLRPNDKNIYVTRSILKEWLEECRVKSMNPASSKESPATTRQASSPTKAPGSSSTEESKLRQDAVSQMLKKLR